MNKRNILLGATLLLANGYIPFVNAMLSKFERSWDGNTSEQKRMNDFFLESCKTNKLHIVEHYVSTGANKNARCENLGFTGRHYAAGQGYLALLQYLMKNENYPEDYLINDLTPVYLATKRDRFEVMKWYIEQKNIDINVKDEDGITLAIIASEYGASSVLQLLVDKGANISPANKTGKDAFAVACAVGSVACAKILLPYVNVNRYLDNETKVTSLYIAAGFGYLPTVKFLMEHGADPEICTRDGNRAIDIAKNFDYAEIVTYLEKWNLSKKSAEELLVSESKAEAKKAAKKTTHFLKQLNGDIQSQKKYVVQNGKLEVATKEIKGKENKNFPVLVDLPHHGIKVSKKSVKVLPGSDFVSISDDRAGYGNSSIFLFPDNAQGETYYYDVNDSQELIEVPQKIDNVGAQLSSNHLSQAGYSVHVKTKMQLANDIFHSFSESIEKEHGHLARTKIVDFKNNPQKKQYWEKQLGDTHSIDNRWFELHSEIPAQIRYKGYLASKAKEEGPTGVIKYIVLAEGLADQHEKTIVHRCFELYK